MSLREAGRVGDGLCRLQRGIELISSGLVTPQRRSDAVGGVAVYF